MLGDAQRVAYLVFGHAALFEQVPDQTGLIHRAPAPFPADVVESHGDQLMAAVLPLQLDQLDALEIAFGQNADIHSLLELLIQVFQCRGATVALDDDVVVS